MTGQSLRAALGKRERHARPGGNVTDRGNLARPAVFGAFDGTASLIGVVLYLVLTHPRLIFPAALAAAGVAAACALSFPGGG